MSAAAVGRVWLIAAVALFAAGCQGGAAPPTPARATMTPAPTATAVTVTPLPPTSEATAAPTATLAPTATKDVGWVTHQAPDFSIALPEGWQVQPVDDANAAALFESLQRTDSHLAGIVSSPEAIRSSVLLAFAAPAESWFTDNVNIRRIPLGGQEMADLGGTIAAVSAELERLGFTVLSAENDLELAGSPAARLISGISSRIPAGETAELRSHQYLVVTGDDLWILGYTTVVDRDEIMRPVFEQSAGTFRPK